MRAVCRSHLIEGDSIIQVNSYSIVLTVEKEAETFGQIKCKQNIEQTDRERGSVICIRYTHANFRKAAEQKYLSIISQHHGFEHIGHGHAVID